MLIFQECNVWRGFGGVGFHFSCPDDVIDFDVCYSHSGIIQSDWVKSHVCVACLSERNNLLGRLMLSTSLLFWKKLGDHLNRWLAHHEPQQGMASPSENYRFRKSFILVPRLMSIAKETGGKHSNIFQPILLWYMNWAVLQSSFTILCQQNCGERPLVTPRIQ